MASPSETQGDAWKAPTDHAMQAIVSIETATPFSFGDASAGCAKGTGFVVDTEIGIIITNRHMVNEGPTHTRAIFHLGARQCLITPLFVDPVHDFALCKYDIENIQGLSPIQLRPDLAKVGVEIRILGNDENQIMSILQSVISRVNCNPPHWDFGKYHRAELFSPQLTPL